jgi:hypothetical protein
MAEFGEVVATNVIYSQEQIDRRLYGDSDIKYNGIPTVYHAGDVVHLPYASGETSTIEAIGLAWGSLCKRRGA